MNRLWCHACNRKFPQFTAKSNFIFEGKRLFCEDCIREAYELTEKGDIDGAKKLLRLEVVE